MYGNVRERATPFSIPPPGEKNQITLWNHANCTAEYWTAMGAWCGCLGFGRKGLKVSGLGFEAGMGEVRAHLRL